MGDIVKSQQATAQRKTAAGYKREIDDCLAEIARLGDNFEREQADIDLLREQTRAIIDEIKKM
jgi:molecular chaperone GrpE (heat shock protein)